MLSDEPEQHPKSVEKREKNYALYGIQIGGEAIKAYTEAVKHLKDSDMGDGLASFCLALDSLAKSSPSDGREIDWMSEMISAYRNLTRAFCERVNSESELSVLLIPELLDNLGISNSGELKEKLEDYEKIKEVLGNHEINNPEQLDTELEKADKYDDDGIRRKITELEKLESELERAKLDLFKH